MRNFTILFLIIFTPSNKPDSPAPIKDRRKGEQITHDNDYIRNNFVETKSTEPLLNGIDDYYYYNYVGNSNACITNEKESFIAVDSLDRRKDEPRGDEDRSIRSMSLILTSSVMDIYVDISSSAGTSVRESSVEFGEDNWIRLLNTFKINEGKFENTYGQYKHKVSGASRGELVIVFTDMPSKGINGYYDSLNFSGYSDSKVTIPARNIIHLNYKLLENDNLAKVEEMLFYELQHLVNYAKQSSLNGPRAEQWINNMLSESTYYLLRGDTLPDSLINYMVENFKSDENIRNGYYFTQWNHTNTYSHVTLKMFTYWIYLHFLNDDFGSGYNIFHLIAESRDDIVQDNNISYRQFESVVGDVHKDYSSWGKYILVG